MRKHSLLIIRKMKRGSTTTDSRHRFKLYPNLIKGLIIDRPHLLWVSDITYLSVYTGYCYLSLITDAYSHKIVGYHVYYNLKTLGLVTALRMALKTLNPDVMQELFHHSDRGSQYCSDAYVQISTTHPEIRITMTENGDPYENAIAERINGILKSEFNLDQLFQSMSDLKAAFEKSIQAYNGKRPHASCNYLTPNQAHEETGVPLKRWKNTYVKKSDDVPEIQELADL